jgi:hypothetical protein
MDGLPVTAHQEDPMRIAQVAPPFETVPPTGTAAPNAWSAR